MIPNTDPSLPNATNPYFQDNGFVRGDQLRNNNSIIWGNFAALDWQSLTNKTSLVDADLLGIADSAASYAYKNITRYTARTNILFGEYGLTLSNSSGKILAVAAGQCWDSTRQYGLILGSFTGSLAGTWATGSGSNKLDTGTVANNTTYHIYVIAKAGGLNTDILFSTSTSSPTMPSTYTLKRRVGSLRTDSGGDWVLFTQSGNEFLLSTYVLDYDSGGSPGTSALDVVLTSIPIGFSFQAIINAALNGNGVNAQLLVSEKAVTDQVPSVSVSPLFQIAAYNIGDAVFAQRIQIRTNTASTIRYRIINGGAAGIHGYAVTIGWIDPYIVGLGI